MSSCGNPNTEQDALMPRRLRFNKGRDCIKCKMNPGKIVIRHAVYCKECFMPLVTSKFRRSLESFVNANARTPKRPRLKASGSLVLGFSGGLGSSVLLDMVHKTYFSNESFASSEPRGGTNHPRNANVWTSCVVCYVEVCNAFPETRDRTSEIKEALASYPKFDFIPLRLEYAFDDSWWRAVKAMAGQGPSQLTIELGKDGLCTEVLRHTPVLNLSPIDALRTYLGSLPTQTAISSAIRVLVRLLMLHTARSRQASHLFLGTSLTTLSISLISCISQGGGHSILEEFQEEWHCSMSTTSESIHTIHVIRPLRDVTMKECSMFAWWNSIRVLGRDRQARATSGIPGLTKDFIINLERDYPSTVSTVVRTCAKLEPKSASMGPCILCQRPVQQGLDAWKSQVSIRSHSDAKLGSGLVSLPMSAPSNSLDVFAASDRSILRHLCYPCRTTLTSRGSRSARPTSLTSRVVDSGQSLSTPLPLWVSMSYTETPAQDKQLMMPENGELWVREPLDEVTQRNRIADFLLDNER